MSITVTFMNRFMKKYSKNKKSNKRINYSYERNSNTINNDE